MLTFDEDQIIEAMRLVVARRRKAQEPHKQETADNLGELTTASQTEKSRASLNFSDTSALTENNPVINAQNTTSQG